jgi:glycine cleavage system H protein
MNFPEDLLYTDEHEWARVEDDGSVTVGITDHAQDALGDVVYVEVPEVGASFEAGEDFGVVESVKTVSDLYAPVSGEIVAVNEELEDAPEMVNEEPYGGGWVVRIEPADDDELDALMDVEAYREFLEG